MVATDAPFEVTTCTDTLNISDVIKQYTCTCTSLDLQTTTVLNALNAECTKRNIKGQYFPLTVLGRLTLSALG